MDAQNAVQPASTKPSAASPKRPSSDPTRPISTSVIKPPIVFRTSPAKERTAKAAAGPPGPASQTHHDDDGSEAETVVLPGKDGYSPSKVRKVIKHEDRSDGEDNINVPPSRGRKYSTASKDGNDRDRARDKAGDRDKKETISSSTPSLPSEGSSLVGRKKRLHEKPRSKEGSSGLSSAPASPPTHRTRRSSNARAGSDSETVTTKSPLKTSATDKSRSVIKLVSHKRKAPKAESDDEAENRKARRQRISGAGPEGSQPGNKAQRDAKPSSGKSHNDPNPPSRTRSVSPNPRAHRRSISTQLPSQSSNGLSYKKKRVPAPLQSTEYHSDDSSASGSPHQRSSKLRTNLATPATAEPTISPAKMPPHKKHLDAHGQTWLARACARGEYDMAKSRLAERPEDLNVADYAGNTPLQIAAINGCADIVQLLVDAGCNLDCVNFDKDTPLLDAVDNGHLEVVRLLLDAGVNPRKANVSGQEPLDRVNENMDNATEIRAALVAARQKMGDRRRTSEDHHDHDARSSHGPESPRRSPGAGSSSHAVASTRRGGTVRATKTSNHLLYMPMDDKTLRQAAARGDEETVTRILQVRDTFDDPESMVAAARGGHEMVMQLLLALGSANPDPGPVSSVSSEFATPILAAIGQENLEVIKLLLKQADFDPTRRFKGDTYYEIARKRQGTNWKEEEHLLKEAYDKYKQGHKDGSAKTKSPNRRERDQERGDLKRTRADTKEEPPRSNNRKASSPSRDVKKANPGKPSISPKDKKRSNSFSDQTSPKRGPARPKRDDSETSPQVTSKQPPKPKRIDSEAVVVSSDAESVKAPRRKLVSGKELKGEREKQRRASMTSNAPSTKDPPSPHESRHDDPIAKQKTGRPQDRTKALKRDESRDGTSAAGDSSGKRHRTSTTPPRHGVTDKDGSEVPPKKRRLEGDSKMPEKRQKTNASPNDRPSKPGLSREPSSTTGKPAHKERNDDERKASSKPKKAETAAEHLRKESLKLAALDKKMRAKAEDGDVEMRDAEPPLKTDDVKARDLRAKEEERKKKAELEAQALEKKKREEEQKRREEEETRRKEEEEAKRREEEEKHRREEEERKRKEEEERKQREEEERQQREEEERKKREEEERKRREEEERKRREEEERKQREEEERLRREQLEREAAEEARRKREEEERKARALREEMERQQRVREAELRRIREEQERIRLAKLPPLLRWLDQCPGAKLAPIAEKFSMMQGVRYDCICPEYNGKPEGREQWLLNTQVALLLGEKDLGLSKYPAWERKPVSMTAKKIIWRLEADRYALTSPSLFDIGNNVPNYYQGEDPDRMRFAMMDKLRAEAWEKFSAMDLFFVKASELMSVIPTIDHLRNVKLTMAYRELPDDSQPLKWNWNPEPKWKKDPGADRFLGFAPRNKYYVNGQLVSEEKPRLAQLSKTPFPEKRVPRRGGLVAVYPGDPDYVQICKEQGFEHLLSEGNSPSLANGVSSSPTSTASNQLVSEANGFHSPIAATTPTINGDGHHHRTPLVVHSLVNGVNGNTNGT